MTPTGAGRFESAAYPIIEFDPDPVAMVEPSAHLGSPSGDRDLVEMPERAVMCFFGDVVEHVASHNNARVVVDLVSEHGSHQVWELEVDGQLIAFFQPGVGAPLAACFFEEAIDYGVRVAVACGAAGALVPELDLGHKVLVTGAVRDEGTSYHYLPPSRHVDAEPEVVAAMEAVLRDEGEAFTAGRTWTTDAPYRETPSRVARRRHEGCLTVEMEASALLAVAHWRGVKFGQLLYAGDSLGGEEWDHRGWSGAHEVRESLFWLAVKACLAI